METMSALENSEQKPADNPAPAPENAPVSAPNSEPVNTVAETIAPAELLPRRGPGRPKGSKTKNRRDASGKFVPAATVADILPPDPAPSAPQFVSSIPGHDGPQAEPDPAQPGASQPAPEIAPAAPPVDYRAMAVMLVTMSTGILAKTVGPEWEPENETEKDFLVSSVEAYLRVKQTPDIPPGAMLCICLAGYSAKRITQPATRSFLSRVKLRLQKLALAIKGKFSRRSPVASTIPFPQPATA